MKYDIEIIATPEEEQQLYELIHRLNLKYESYSNPEDDFYYIHAIDASEHQLLLLRLTGAEIYPRPSK